MRLFYASHPEVEIDPAVPVPDWRLSDVGHARAAALGARGWPGGAVRVVTSPERKARDTAALLAPGRAVEVHEGTGEIDRSATGYVPFAQHEELADRLFASPEVSADGWERAVDAQARMVAALGDLAAAGDDLLLVGHGGVGTLLWCALAERPVARREDQPGGGYAWAVEGAPGNWRPVHAWQAFEALG